MLNFHLLQRAFYFSEEYMRFLFEENGFVTEEIELCCKQVENRSRELVMNRYVWNLHFSLPKLIYTVAAVV